MTSDQTDEQAGGPEAEQDTYLPPLQPPDTILPPNSDQFANATWLKVGPEITKLVEEALGWDEFDEISGIEFSAVWRRNSTPKFNDEQPRFVGVDLVPQRIVWQAYQEGIETFPRYFIDLFWLNFEALREEGQYVHHGIFQQHLHHALSSLSAENDILRRRGPDFSGYAATVKRFGEWNSGIAKVANQLALWPNADE